eukprot:6481550-Amphidinium_carterae.1
MDARLWEQSRHLMHHRQNPHCNLLLHHHLKLQSILLHGPSPSSSRNDAEDRVSLSASHGAHKHNHTHTHTHTHTPPNQPANQPTKKLCGLQGLYKQLCNATSNHDPSERHHPCNNPTTPLKMVASKHVSVGVATFPLLHKENNL